MTRLSFVFSFLSVLFLVQPLTITEEQASALVHYQDNTRETWLLVKMPESENKQQATGSISQNQNQTDGQ